MKILTFFLLIEKLNSAKDSKNKRNSTAAGDFNSNAPNLIVYNLTEIEVATDNLSIENKLGEGGYGPVYKVIFSSLYSTEGYVYIIYRP